GKKVVSAALQQAVDLLGLSWDACHQEVSRWRLVTANELDNIGTAVARATEVCSTPADRTAATASIRRLRERVDPSLQAPYRESPWAVLRTGYALLADDERPLLDEAVRALRAECRRACIVLAWGLGAARLRKHIINNLGFGTYNTHSQGVQASNDRRLRRFSRHFEANSESELKYVPDAHLVGVIYVSGAVDGTQYDQLADVVEKRNNCAHPGAWEPAWFSAMSILEEISNLVILNPNLQ
ncbi:MAG TPA: hypothetical protein QGH10_23440, partial [Armatimonadota bacterium]|nr:hypothetical protein [Armatimonadota bacterium]